MKRTIGTAFVALGLLLSAQALTGQNSATQVQLERPGDNPIYSVTINVVERDIKAVNYRQRGGSTRVDFRGTALMPDVEGVAEVQSKQGYVEIEAELDELKPASQFGPEYLTYVLWAITPEGRPANLGELIREGDRSKLDVTTELQAFGLIVTAEPYFAVTQPSDVVVAENFIRKDTRGEIEEIDAKFELLQRGQYTVNAVPSDLKPAVVDSKTPLDLAQARNAIRIATWTGAQKHAPDVLQKAIAHLNEAETLHQKDKNKRDISTASRQAVQVAEDARLITLKRMDEARLAEERRAAADREARALAQAQTDARLRAEAEADSRLQAERRARAEAEERAAKERAEASRLEAERIRQEAARTAEEARLAQQKAATEAEVARLEADRARQDAARAGEEARLVQQKAELQAEEARKALQQAEQEKADLRARLIEQFNLVLETRDTARGLIVNMSDVLFDTGQHSLKPGAREKLARVAGIVLAHPGLKLEVEGHTDSVGSEDYNQSLSERRASAVRDYLVQQKIPAESITAKGYGESRPVATNDSGAGRQQNRRVELVVSGEIIGTSTVSRLQR